MVTAVIDYNSPIQTLPPDAVGVTLSTYGANITTTPAQVAALGRLNAKGYRIPLQYNGGDIVSAAGGGPRTSGSGDKFIDGIIALGGTPHIVIGGTKDNNMNPQDCAGMVKHFGQKVRHYIIGNEAGNGGMSIEAYSQLFLSCAQAMKAADPGITVAGPAWASYDLGKITTFLGIVGSHVDIIDYHHYGMGSTSLSTADALSRTADWEHECQAIRSLLDGKGLHSVGIQCGEFNWSWRFADGVSGGDMRFYKPEIVVWAASVIGHLLTGGGRAFQYSDQNGPLGTTVEPGNRDQGKPGNSPQPVYHGVGAWTGESTLPGVGTVLYKSSTDTTGVEVFATNTKVVLINKTAATQTVVIESKDGKGSFSVHALTNPADPYSLPLLSTPAVVQQVTLPGLALAVLTYDSVIPPVIIPPVVIPPVVVPPVIPPGGTVNVTGGTVIGAGAPPDWAKLIQRLLVKAGYTDQQINGGYGLTTTKNVMDFQGKNGLPKTGWVDEVTLDHLIG